MREAERGENGEECSMRERERGQRLQRRGEGWRGHSERGQNHGTLKTSEFSGSRSWEVALRKPESGE